MNNARRRPAPALRGLVTDYRGYHYADLPPGVHHGLPSSELTVVIAFGEPLDVAWLGEDSSRDRHWVLASGLHGGPALIRHSGFQHGIQLGLTPHGARALLGLPAAELAASFVPLAQLVPRGVHRMYDEVTGATTWSERFAILDRHLLDWVGHTDHKPMRPEVAHAWQVLEETSGRVRVDRLADIVGWSRRHLATQLTREVGLSPKQLARVLRFQRSRGLMLSAVSLSEAAVLSGYADQAHLTREWRELAGYTPMQWRRAELPFLQDGLADS